MGGGPWGSICANIPYDETKRQDVWTRVRATRVANAACRSLGFTGGLPQGPVYGRAPNATLTNLACTGWERSLSQCSFTRPSVACEYHPRWAYNGYSDDEGPSYLSVACAGEHGRCWEPADQLSCA